jgi:hypothetical protein
VPPFITALEPATPYKKIIALVAVQSAEAGARVEVVITLIAIEGVGTAKSVERIVAGTAIQDIVPSVTIDCVSQLVAGEIDSCHSGVIIGRNYFDGCASAECVVHACEDSVESSMACGFDDRIGCVVDEVPIIARSALNGRYPAPGSYLQSMEPRDQSAIEAVVSSPSLDR